VLTTGLRRGEALALSWADVDLDGGTVAVRHTLAKAAGGWELAETKTASSRRVVRLPLFAVDALRQHRVRQLSERLRSGVTWPDSDLVFTTTSGTAIDGSNLLRAFKSLLRAAELPDLRFHDLRHSAATFMLSIGIQPKVVAETLGHSRVGVTLDTYSHVLPHLQEEAAAKMNLLLGKSTRAV
jgi:integrase